MKPTLHDPDIALFALSAFVAVALLCGIWLQNTLELRRVRKLCQRSAP